MNDLKLKIHVDTEEFDIALDRIKAAMESKPKPDTTIGALAVTAAVASAASKPIPRRSILGFGWLFRSRGR